MEEKYFSSESESETEKEMIHIKDFGKELRGKITKCINEERKRSKKLDKRLSELEIEMFGYVVKDMKSKPGRPLKSLSKLEDLISLYSSMKDFDEKISDMKKIYYKYFEKEMEREFVLS